MRLSLIAVSFLSLAGCKKEEAAPPAAAPAAAPAPAPAPAAAPAAPAAAAAGPKCPEGSQGVSPPGYCVKLPADYKQKPPELQKDQGTIGYTNDAGNSFEIFYSNATLQVFLANMDEENKMKMYKDVTSGPLPNGGKWFQRIFNGDTTQVYGIYKTAGGALSCHIAYDTKHPPVKEAIEACKTLTIQ
jgi:hypothetical protein